MSDDFDGDGGGDEYGEGGIPPDMEADIEDRVRAEVEERMGDVYDDARPRSGGCLLILALPLLGLWFLG
jgi:hypothetical protein